MLSVVGDLVMYLRSAAARSVKAPENSTIKTLLSEFLVDY